jgi:hypothetical protein
MYSIIDIAFVDGDSRLREKEYRWHLEVEKYKETDHPPRHRNECGSASMSILKQLYQCLNFDPHNYN